MPLLKERLWRLCNLKQDVAGMLIVYDTDF